MNVRLYIDYDNVDELLKREGILSLATRSLLRVPIPTASTGGRCEARVYGGWYEGTELTPLAQRIIAELGRDFPTLLPFRNGAGELGNSEEYCELFKEALM